MEVESDLVGVKSGAAFDKRKGESNRSKRVRRAMVYTVRSDEVSTVKLQTLLMKEGLQSNRGSGAKNQAVAVFSEC
jgi:hypothetical protein